MLVRERQRGHARRQVAVAVPGAALAARGLERFRHHAHRHAGQSGHNGFVPINVKVDPDSNLLTGTFGNTSYSSGVTYSEDETKFGYTSLNGRWAASDTLVLSGQLSVNNSKALSYQDTLSGQIFGVTSTIDYGDDHVYPSLSSTSSYTDLNNYQGFDVGTGWTRETDKAKQGRLIADWDYQLPGEWKGHLKAGVSYVDTSTFAQATAAQYLLAGRMPA
eukprot:gene36172-40915_t